MEYLIKNKHWQINRDYSIDKLLYLLIDRPDQIDGWCNFIWKNNINQWHRDYDLPAYIGEIGSFSWYIKGIKYK